MSAAIYSPCFSRQCPVLTKGTFYQRWDYKRRGPPLQPPQVLSGTGPWQCAVDWTLPLVSWRGTTIMVVLISKKLEKFWPLRIMKVLTSKKLARSYRGKQVEWVTWMSPCWAPFFMKSPSGVETKSVEERGCREAEKQQKQDITVTGETNWNNEVQNKNGTKWFLMTLLSKLKGQWNLCATSEKNLNF